MYQWDRDFDTLVEDRLFRVALREPEQQQEVFLFMEWRGPALRDTGVYGLHLQPPAQDGPTAPQRIGLHGPCHAAIQGRQQCEHYLIMRIEFPRPLDTGLASLT